MKFIRVEDTGVQYQFILPSMEPDDKQIDTNVSESKRMRIDMMLKAQGKQSDAKLVFENYVEPGFVYVTMSGFEYIKMDITEFWNMINVLNALANIDADELGFFGLNLFVCREKNGASKEYELAQFEYNTFAGNVLGICDALMAGELHKDNYNTFFNDIRILG